MTPDELFCNWQPAPPEEELLRLLKTGMAIKADSYWVIKLVHVYSLKEYLDTVHKYSKLIRSRKNHVCLFRGQNRDYFEEDYLIIIPPAYRNQKLENMYFNKSELIDALSPWEQVLKNTFNLNIRSGAFFMFKEKDNPNFIRRFAIDNSPDGRISSNPILMALLQHYGFPTANLDVTSDPLIALWFALHKANTDEEGKIFYTTISNVIEHSEPDINYRQPSVYVYLENFNDSYDLTQIENIREIANRPFVQHAFSLPFRKTAPTPYGSPGTPKMTVMYGSPTSRIPVSVLKIHFGVEELLELHNHLTTEYLFPKSEPMYERLIENNVPYLAKYK